MMEALIVSPTPPLTSLTAQLEAMLPDEMASLQAAGISLTAFLRNHSATFSTWWYKPYSPERALYVGLRNPFPAARRSDSTDQATLAPIPSLSSHKATNVLRSSQTERVNSSSHRAQQLSKPGATQGEDSEEEGEVSLRESWDAWDRSTEAPIARAPLPARPHDFVALADSTLPSSSSADSLTCRHCDRAGAGFQCAYCQYAVHRPCLQAAAASECPGPKKQVTVGKFCS